MLSQPDQRTLNTVIPSSDGPRGGHSAHTTCRTKGDHMGDPRRFHFFAEYIAARIPRSAHIVDVASGRGILQAALRERRFSHVPSWDRRRRSPYNRHGHRYDWFRHDTQESYDAVVAMHPDEGTDHAILYAGHHQISAIICPCCVRPSARPFLEPAKYHVWCAHLERMAQAVSLQVRWDRLPMNGRTS
jgi:hypothetical protein